MDFDRDEKRISDALDELDLVITPHDLMQGIQAKMQSAAAPKRKRGALPSMIAAAVLVALLGVTAFAVSFGGFDWLIEKTEVPFGDVVETTYQSVESEGIRITVIAKKSYNDMSVLYVTLEDIDGLGRISEDIQITFGMNDMIQSYFSDLLYYDSESGIAAYEIRLGAADTFDGQTLMLDIEGLRYGRNYLGEIQMDINLTEAVTNGEYIGEPYTDSTQMPSENLTIGHVADIEGTKSAWVSAIGVSRGYLAVQFGQPTNSNFLSMSNNSLRPYLLDPDGTIVEPDSGASGFSVDANMQNIEEHYFDVDTDALDGYKLCFEATTWETIESDWILEVDFNSVSEVLEVSTDIEVEGVCLNDVTLTLHPLGMTLVGDYVSGNGYFVLIMVDTVIETINGDIVLDNPGVSRSHSEGEFTCVWHAITAIDMDSVTAIRIGDNRIEIRQENE